MSTFKSKLNTFIVLNYIPNIRSVIESSASDIHANLMVLAVYTYIDLYLDGSCLSNFNGDELKKISSDILISFDHRDIDNQAIKQIDWASKYLTDTPPENCGFKVGDVVTYTNDYDVSFEHKLIIGFDHKEPERPVHTASESYWFGSNPLSLTKSA
jgi:hypothetical protein